MWSPELKKKQPYNFDADYYAFGIIMHQLLTGKLPRFAHDTNELVQFDYNISPKAYHFLSAILNQDPSKRPPLADLKQHPFMQCAKYLPATLPHALTKEPPTGDFIRQYTVSQPFKLLLKKKKDQNARKLVQLPSHAQSVPHIEPNVEFRARLDVVRSYSKLERDKETGLYVDEELRDSQSKFDAKVLALGGVEEPKKSRNRVLARSVNSTTGTLIF